MSSERDGTRYSIEHCASSRTARSAGKMAHARSRSQVQSGLLAADEAGFWRVGCDTGLTAADELPYAEETVWGSVIAVVTALVAAAGLAFAGAANAKYPPNPCAVLLRTDIVRFAGHVNFGPGPDGGKLGFCVYHVETEFPTHGADTKIEFNVQKPLQESGQKAFAQILSIVHAGIRGWIFKFPTGIGDRSVALFTNRRSKSGGLQGEIDWMQRGALVQILIDDYVGSLAQLEQRGISLARTVSQRLA